VYFTHFTSKPPIFVDLSLQHTPESLELITQLHYDKQNLLILTSKSRVFYLYKFKLISVLQSQNATCFHQTAQFDHRRYILGFNLAFHNASLALYQIAKNGNFSEPDVYTPIPQSQPILQVYENSDDLYLVTMDKIYSSSNPAHYDRTNVKVIHFHKASAFLVQTQYITRICLRSHAELYKMKIYNCLPTCISETGGFLIFNQTQPTAETISSEIENMSLDDVETESGSRKSRTNELTIVDLRSSNLTSLEIPSQKLLNIQPYAFKSTKTRDGIKSYSVTCFWQAIL